jgi:hypothetical protein
MKKVPISGLLVLASVAIASTAIANSAGPPEMLIAQKTKPNVITLTQVGCQFIEGESKNYGFKTSKAEDCQIINTKTLTERQKSFKPLRLQAGEYIFRVTNKNVPYELGFYLRGAGLTGVTLPKVSGGGLTAGKTLEYKVTLRPGSYVYNCPLNPTPDYPLVVQ